MLVDNGKMSKSLGNTYRITELADKGYPPMVFRFFCLNAHYRKRLNFTFEGISAAATAYERLLNSLYQHKVSAAKTLPKILEKYKKDFSDAINDDLNVPMALGILFTMLKEEKSVDIYNLALDFDKVFGLDLNTAAPKKEDEVLSDIPAEIIALAEERIVAKKAKDFAKSDMLRNEIASRGYAVIDVPDGYRIELRV